MGFVYIVIIGVLMALLLLTALSLVRVGREPSLRRARSDGLANTTEVVPTEVLESRDDLLSTHAANSSEFEQAGADRT